MEEACRNNAIPRRAVLAAAGAAAANSALPAAVMAQPSDPLASWNAGPAKQAILDFVRASTDWASPDFVQPEDRVATFDQDGTLWVEHPVYTQAAFALDRVGVLAPQHPEWKIREPFKSVLARNMAAVAKFTEAEWLEIVSATHAGMSTQDFLDIAGNWLKAAVHPRFKRPYTALVYQPMREVMTYLRAGGFRTYIVTGGGQEFVRVYASEVYGVPPEQVIGSSIATSYVVQDGKPELLRLAKPFFINDGPGKPVGINMFIGKRPCAAFGNSDGDRQMLEWTGAAPGASLKMLVHHDDAVREYAYGPAGGLPDGKVGTFSNELMTDARSRGWTVISMRDDWKRIFAFDAA
jgi:hypothetical protein